MSQNFCQACGRPFKKPRSLNQNSYMFGIVYKLLADHLGYTIDEIHELMKQKFLSRTISIKSESFNVPLSTTELDTVGMEDYLQQIREWAYTALGCSIPKPNEDLEGLNE